MTDENDTGTDDTDHEEDESSAPEDGRTDDGPDTPEAAFEQLIRPQAASEHGDAIEDLEDLKFIGPATSESLEAADIGVESILDGAVSFRDLVAAGVNPGVAAKIRRWHSLSWSFSSGDDLDRRSSQVRGLDDEERQWIAASSGSWKSDEEPESGDWTPTGATATGSASSPARDGDWTPKGDTQSADGVSVQDGDWTPSGDDGAGTSPRTSGDWTPGQSRGTTADGSGDALAAEAAWRERSKPTPLTVLDGVGEEEAEMLSEAGVRSVRRLATADPEHIADALLIDEGRVSEWKRQARDVME
ncbi:helix-hairpin-helix domain-containing protein [Haloferax namakaokahaiae]|uniref:Helix-hairpin-helix domain-containing protein n=1 Tax=Haloferax namakaokahaiae TaxID=1748331 RepID=A0ABD5ZEK6_9EURY